MREAGLECEGNPGVAVGVDGLAGEPLQGGEVEPAGEIGVLGPVGEPFFSGLVPSRVGRGGLGIDGNGVVRDLVDCVRGVAAVVHEVTTEGSELSGSAKDTACPSDQEYWVPG